jgi:disulfide bond formation protein DsbB
MSRRYLILLAVIGSTLLLGGALAFQYVGGLQPCHICLWERWPHRVAIAIGVLALALPVVGGRRVLAILGALSMAVSAGLGLYHVGVEQHWWEGPTSCTGSDIAGLKTDDLLNQIMNAPVVHCDQIAWEMWGISMAGWNMIFSLLLVAVWVKAAMRRPRS